MKAKVLILGSMPGAASLDAQQYYAHPRNHFWPIMQALFHIDTQLDYDQRCQQLIAQQIGLWDVLQACDRRGSLDSNIEATSMVPNDFSALLNTRPQISKIFFNGAKAQQVFDKYVQQNLTKQGQVIPTVRLLSTSPANAAYTFDDKLADWQQIKDCLQA